MVTETFFSIACVEDSLHHGEEVIQPVMNNRLW